MFIKPRPPRPGRGVKECYCKPGVLIKPRPPGPGRGYRGSTVNLECLLNLDLPDREGGGCKSSTVNLECLLNLG